MACVNQPPPSDNSYCAVLFDQLDGFELPLAPIAVGFDFRQMQLARIRQARCITFSDRLAGMDALARQIVPHAIPGGPGSFLPPVAVQAGVVTNPQDEARALTFFSALGYRARSVGWPELGTRIYVEAKTANQIADIVSVAQQAGFVGPYPSNWVRF